MNNSVEKFRAVAHGRVFAAIDAANLELSVKDMYVHPRDVMGEWVGTDPGELAWGVDYRKLKLFFQTNSRLMQIAFYSPHFKTETHDGFLTVLKDAGYEICTKPVKQYADHLPTAPHRKANFDVEIAVDAVAGMEHSDTFILFSGDSDFAYLLHFLRKHQKRTILFSRRGHVAKELFSTIDDTPVLDRYFDIIDFRNEFLRLKKPKTPREAGFGS